MTQAQAASANFAIAKLPLSVTKTGEGTGTVTSTPAGIDCGATCSASFDVNSNVTLTATPPVGSQFSGWTGACTGTANSCTVTMTQAQTVSAGFAFTKVALDIAKTGQGTGTVVSFPAGIDCGATCSAEFNQYNTVTLTATPAAGSLFESWSGGCTGTNSSCVVTLSQAQTVQAEFSAPAMSTFQYDPNGNLTQASDPLNHTRTFGYDSLDRPIQTREPHPDLPGQTLGQVDADYNPLGQITRITDPRNLETGLQRDALGNLNSQTSPDTGLTTFTYDDAGNVKTRTDARNKPAQYSYDSQNRISQIVHEDQTVNYTWDNCANGIGRLCILSNDQSSLTYSYDSHGRITGKSQAVGGVTLNTSYSYNTLSQWEQTVTPGGHTIGYVWLNDRVDAVTVNGQLLIGQIAYEPDGQLRGWTWSNNTTSQRLYDLSGRPEQIDLGLDAQSQQPEALTYGYDAAGRVTDISHAVDASTDQHHDYDSLDRLVATDQGLPLARMFEYAYDLSGNRTSKVQNSNTETHTIDPGSNRLQGTSGSENQAYSYDAAGNLTGDGTFIYTYNAEGRRLSATATGQAISYGYNALGQRVSKTVNGVTTRYVYDEQGHLTGEYDASGQLIQEIVWFGNLPIAVLKPGATTIDVYYLHADHLGTPRKINRPSDNKAVWAWESEAFGNSLPNQNPSNLGEFVFNLRFPGQYYDAETGLHYNYFRDYDPATGRYIQSDPIGLAGGLNTYGYVGGNPVNTVDPSGLEAYTPYPNMNSAACDAACDARKLPQNREYGSLIYPCEDGGFCYTPPTYNPDPQFPYTTWEPDKSQLPAGSAEPCADIHTHWRASGYKRTWNQIHDGDRLSNWILTPPRTGYVATPDRGLLRYDPFTYPSSPGSGPVNPVSCSCETRQR
jgi:RHS repeat-associated protein